MPCPNITELWCSPRKPINDLVVACWLYETPETYDNPFWGEVAGSFATSYVLVVFYEVVLGAAGALLNQQLGIEAAHERAHLGHLSLRSDSKNARIHIRAVSSFRTLQIAFHRVLGREAGTFVVSMLATWSPIGRILICRWLLPSRLSLGEMCSKSSSEIGPSDH